MQTLSSARRTCMESASAVECTATVRMPSSRQARRMRSAISPRLAMSIFSNMAGVSVNDASFDDGQHFAVFDRGTGGDQQAGERAGAWRLDLVEGLHRLD